MLHEKETSPALLKAIEEAEAEDASAAASSALEDRRISATIKEARRSFDMEAKLSADLAERRAALGSEAYMKWTKARAANDFSQFEDTLGRCFSTVAEVARARASSDSCEDLYSVCLDEYERGMAAGRIEELFGEVEDKLRPLIDAVLSSPHAPSAAALSPASDSEAFAVEDQE